MIKRKNLEQDQCQDVNRPFRVAHLVISGAMLFCELAWLLVLLSKQPSLTQAQVYLFLLISGAVVMPLFFGFGILTTRR